MENETLITHRVDIRLRKYGNDHHPRLIIEDFGNKFVAVEMTHEKKKGKDRINYQLSISTSNDKRPSYVRTRAEIKKKNQYGSVVQTILISDKDYKKLKKFAEKAINKYQK
ncbi:MAG: hypothetical protein LUC16_01240 [Coprobacillus sp.]|nr:hypothetical protein [Coprobacillus sp.]